MRGGSVVLRPLLHRDIEFVSSCFRLLITFRYFLSPFQYVDQT